MYYATTDNLGSINMIFKPDGSVVSDLSYDAWGRRRNVQDWTYSNIAPCTITDRGYTMHEHLDNFNLINMNGRAYDPLLAQFLSPDPFVQDPANAQSYNRYSYCLNNPLKFVDPTGYSTYYIDGLPWYGMNDFNFHHYFNNNIENISSIESNGYTVYNSRNFNEQILKDVYRLFKYGSSGYSARYMEYDKGWALQFGMNNEVLTEPNNFLTRSDVLEVKSLFKHLGKIGDEVAQVEGSENVNYGLYLAGIALTAEDVGNNFFYNHTTYTTTKGVLKNMYKANGLIRSARAARFALGSKIIKGLGNVGTGLMAGIAAYNIASDTKNINGLDVADLSVGSLGIINSLSSRFVGYAIPGVGQGVALYSWGRLWFDLGQNYGPSTWYGNDNDKWFK